MSLQNYDAEFGKAVASVVTAQTKSGSNSASWQRFPVPPLAMRSRRAIRSPNPPKADPITDRFIPPSRWAQFGGTIGGAIIKDKFFFFGDYQGTRQTNGVSGTFTFRPTRSAQVATSTNATSATPDSAI